MSDAETREAGTAGAEAVTSLANDSVILRSDTGLESVLASGSGMQMAAMEWTHKVKNRRRWIDQAEVRDQQATDAAQLLLDLGMEDAKLDQLFQSKIIEVAMTYSEESHGWEARIFPWEYILTAAIHAVRPTGLRGPTIIRHLKLPGPARRMLRPACPGKALVVESAPGRIGTIYKFESEISLITNNLGFQKTILRNPSNTEIAKALEGGELDLMHLAGIDTHQAAALGVLDADKVWDGYVLRGNHGAVTFLTAQELAAIIKGANNKPCLVCCNFYNSAARIAPLLIAAGVCDAIGFQDEVDDVLAELFFSNFYLGLRLSEWNLLDAFTLACERVRMASDRVTGAGIVLWSNRSLLAQSEQLVVPSAQDLSDREDVQSRARHPTPATGVVTPAGGLPATLVEGRLQSQVRKSLEKRLSPKDVEIEVEPIEQINYSMLHNDRDLFKKFRLTPLQPGTIEVGVEVQLQVGGLEHPKYEESFSLTGPLDLCRKIRIPLTFVMRIAVQERVYSTLCVKVCCVEGDKRHDILSETYRVTLLPIDEWRDDESDRLWLPSFVLPRDPAIGQVIGSAQRYLMALCDDSNAAFEGYQSLSLSDKEVISNVDLQVQALWCALLYDFSFNYINPPPTYTKQSQRIRTPGELLAGRRGTCIDLALLLAACLEYIEIYPVIFLIKGHAFPGYWRSHAAHEKFVKGDEPDVRIGRLSATTGATGDPNPPWYFGVKVNPRAYEITLQSIRDRDIVPIETVWLTQRGGFYSAIEEGAKNLRSKREFDALVDIYLARQLAVTPIPMNLK